MIQNGIKDSFSEIVISHKALDENETNDDNVPDGKGRTKAPTSQLDDIDEHSYSKFHLHKL